jgi:adenosylcobinamide-GDP ribazoletransferase
MNTLRTSLHSLLEAIRFLTILPLPWLRKTPGDAQEFTTAITRAMGWFPLVGLLVGALAVPFGLLGDAFWGSALRGALVTTVLAVITSGLHLDGLSDTFDAVMSWRNRERMLEIMKDSRIGAMGAMALIVIMLLKTLFVAQAGADWWMALPLACMLGRWADLYAIARYPPAREGGLGRSFHETLQPRAYQLATVSAVVLMALPALWAGPGDASAHLLRGAIAFALVWLVTAYLCRRWVRQLGGLTGDTYGALSEIGEVVALAALTAVWRW